MTQSEALLALLRGRRGHFRMESGYHSESWVDLDSLFLDRQKLEPFVAALAQKLRRYDADVICGPMTGGAELARLIAEELSCANIATERHESPEAAGLLPVRYLIPEDQRDFLRGKSVIIADDAISAGSAVKGSYASLIECGARPVALGALIVFGDGAPRFATEKRIHLESIAQTTFNLWPPGQCPLCTAGIPLEAVSDAGPPSPSS